MTRTPAFFKAFIFSTGQADVVMTMVGVVLSVTTRDFSGVRPLASRTMRTGWCGAS